MNENWGVNAWINMYLTCERDTEEQSMALEREAHNLTSSRALELAGPKI